MRNTQGTNDAFGAQKGFLGYAMRLREALCVKNRLLWYGRDIRYQKPPPTVRNEATGCGHCVDSYDLRICHCVAGSSSRVRLL